MTPASYLSKSTSSKLQSIRFSTKLRGSIYPAPIDEDIRLITGSDTRLLEETSILNLRSSLISLCFQQKPGRRFIIIRLIWGLSKIRGKLPSIITPRFINAFSFEVGKPISGYLLKLG